MGFGGPTKTAPGKRWFVDRGPSGCTPLVRRCVSHLWLCSSTLPLLHLDTLSVKDHIQASGRCAFCDSGDMANAPSSMTLTARSSWFLACRGRRTMCVVSAELSISFNNPVRWKNVLCKRRVPNLPHGFKSWRFPSDVFEASQRIRGACHVVTVERRPQQ